MKLTRVLKSASSSSLTPRTFSGIQPTGALHLGNYFGAVQQWTTEVEAVQSKDERNQRLFSIVDMHAITMPQDPKVLNTNIIAMAASLIGCGLDPEKVILFQQSKVHQHSELCWILGCLTTVTNLSRMSQYKEKSAKLKEVPLGLFVYPVLQAADILLYKATRVPVGEDNLQHVEMTRRIARAFNNKFRCDVFPIPESILVAEQATRRIRSLRDPEKKMSKSDPDQKGCVYVTDDPITIRSKIKKAVTDSHSQVQYDPDTRPGVANLVCIHSGITGQPPADICSEYSSYDTGAYKLKVADIVIDHFTPIREKIEYLMTNKDHLASVLDNGAQTASELAEETMNQVRKVVGFNN
jgi:tryptophanyl-tRNA synthetase